jgi:hypothetical protein
MVTSSEPWPPRVAPGDVYSTVRVVDVLESPTGFTINGRLISCGVERRRVVRDVRCRRVRLWGQLVWVDDETGRVWCPHCWELLDVAVLGAPGNAHPVGLVARSGTLLPMPTDDA